MGDIGEPLKHIEVEEPYVTPAVPEPEPAYVPAKEPAKEPVPA